MTAGCFTSASSWHWQQMRFSYRCTGYHRQVWILSWLARWRPVFALSRLQHDLLWPYSAKLGRLLVEGTLRVRTCCKKVSQMDTHDLRLYGGYHSWLVCCHYGECCAVRELQDSVSCGGHRWKDLLYRLWQSHKGWLKTGDLTQNRFESNDELLGMLRIRLADLCYSLNEGTGGRRVYYLDLILEIQSSGISRFGNDTQHRPHHFLKQSVLPKSTTNTRHPSVQGQLSTCKRSRTVLSFCRCPLWCSVRFLVSGLVLDTSFWIDTWYHKQEDQDEQPSKNTQWTWTIDQVGNILVFT